MWTICSHSAKLISLVRSPRQALQIGEADPADAGKLATGRGPPNLSPALMISLSPEVE
jgi:hypothetical protein